MPPPKGAVSFGKPLQYQKVISPSLLSSLPVGLQACPGPPACLLFMRTIIQPLKIATSLPFLCHCPSQISNLIFSCLICHLYFSIFSLPFSILFPHPLTHCNQLVFTECALWSGIGGQALSGLWSYISEESYLYKAYILVVEEVRQSMNKQV